MDKANLERLQMLLKGHEEMVEEKRSRPEGVLRQNDPFREQFNRVARSVIVPVLEEIKDVMVGKVESASIFHRSTAAGLKVKLDRWEDYDRSLLFFGDDSTQVVKVTHEGIGFGLLVGQDPARAAHLRARRGGGDEVPAAPLRPGAAPPADLPPQAPGGEPPARRLAIEPSRFDFIRV